MLSKAEVMYLQGQKNVSDSCERKLKCLIRKKAESLKAELPLLSKVFPITDLFGYDNKDARMQNLGNPHVTNNTNHATKFSNPKVQNNESAIGCATEFRNAELEKKASTQKNNIKLWPVRASRVRKISQWLYAPKTYQNK